MKRQKKGFTIVELVIVIIIVAILTVVAVPVYQHHVEKARFTEAFTMLRAIADANTVYFIEHGKWCDDISELDVQIEGEVATQDSLVRIETKDFIYACCGDSATSNTIATVNRKPFKERYWMSFTATPNKKEPKLGKYGFNGDATYNKSTKVDKELIAFYKKKYS